MSRKPYYPDDYDGCLNPQCSECKQPCEPKCVDLGIGPYEYWGQKGNDVSYQWLSACCEAEIEEEGTHEKEYLDPVGDDLRAIGLLD